jgi:hypothetical protein
VLELGMTYLKKARGTITAEARAALPETPGSHDLWVEGELFNATGELVARARGPLAHRAAADLKRVDRGRGRARARWLVMGRLR